MIKLAGPCLLTAMHSAAGLPLSRVRTAVPVKGTNLSVLVDTGSPERYTASQATRHQGSKVEYSRSRVTMVFTDSISVILGHYFVSIKQEKRISSQYSFIGFA